ncbi:hypothetical protein M427DRAFT_70273 [Gonapodya prolifera JEL478]|uniref:Uncharacterized protein n=1 Tax=Gonapodya prolifera (strain JEL478) TaxID=1344416 RepID=A0A139ADN3_GONPJ|nr:hypothetical protein M427DRAFT_70273 [Gonapodya prolifera JEL478]|eukprot:KXS14936.1 hypothetical protein M427DRAFT_70273 [Gonapodya prolifera JEL478]
MTQTSPIRDPDIFDVLVLAIDAAFRPHSVSFSPPSTSTTPSPPTEGAQPASAYDVISKQAQNLLLVRWATQSLVIHRFRSEEVLSIPPPTLLQDFGLVQGRWTDAEWLTIQKIGAIGFGMAFTGLAALMGYNYLGATGKAQTKWSDDAEEERSDKKSGEGFDVAEGNRTARRKAAREQGKKGVVKKVDRTGVTDGARDLDKVGGSVSYEMVFKVLSFVGFVPWLIQEGIEYLLRHPDSLNSLTSSSDVDWVWYIRPLHTLATLWTCICAMIILDGMASGRSNTGVGARAGLGWRAVIGGAMVMFVAWSGAETSLWR